MPLRDASSRRCCDRLEREAETRELHIYGHDVDEDEVADVLESPGEDRPGGKDLASRWARRRRAATCESSRFQIRSRIVYS